MTGQPIDFLDRQLIDYGLFEGIFSWEELLLAIQDQIVPDKFNSIDLISSQSLPDHNLVGFDLLHPKLILDVVLVF